MAAIHRKKMYKWTDERVKLMHELLRGIQVIKMYTWENAFVSAINRIRQLSLSSTFIVLVQFVNLFVVNYRNELAGLRKLLLSRGFIMCQNVVSRIAIFLSLMSFILFGNSFNAHQVFIITSYFHFLYDSMSFNWPVSIIKWLEATTSLKRIQDFLLLDESKLEKKNFLNFGFVPDLIEAPKSIKCNEKNITIENCSVFWPNGNGESSPSSVGVEDVNLMIKTSLAIVGGVGSGKTTLMKLISGEIEANKGQVNVNGSVSYATQEPWIFDTTVRQNILFTEDYDAKRYAQVVDVCALSDDLKRFAAGDQTTVGEGGVRLSGGQKARINLARAIYRCADIYLLDDSLSALDPNVAKFIFDNCVCDFLKNKIVIFVTHQTSFVEQFSSTVVLKGGKVSTYNRNDLNSLRNQLNASIQEGISTNQSEIFPIVSFLKVINFKCN